MIEYLYNAIRATAGQDITIAARITEKNEDITTGCGLMLHDKKGGLLTTVDGNYTEAEGIWNFTITADVTSGLKGRYWYCICHDNSNLCFKQPIYLV